MANALQVLFSAISFACLVLAACMAFLPVRRRRAEGVWGDPRQAPTPMYVLEPPTVEGIRCPVIDCRQRPLGELCSAPCIRTANAGGS